MKLRLKLFSAVLLTALTCCGCFSVEYQTVIGRRGGGVRAIEIVMDPMMAGLYNKTPGSDKFFKIPGQGLQTKPGVFLTGNGKTEMDDGSLKLSWSYRTGRAELFSDGNDSVKINITNPGIWICYEYRESILSSQTDSAGQFAGSSTYRIRHKLAMPGQVISHNSDSIQSGLLIWNRPLGQVTSNGLIMEARSRELNPLYLLLAAILLAAGGGYFYWYKVKSLNNL